MTCKREREREREREIERERGVLSCAGDLALERGLHNPSSTAVHNKLTHVPTSFKNTGGIPILTKIRAHVMTARTDPAVTRDAECLVE